MSTGDFIGPAERRILVVERGIQAMSRDLRRLQIDAVALQQGIWANWSDVNIRGTTPTPTPPTPNTTISGQLQSCRASGTAGTIVIVDGGGSTLFTASPGGSGNWSGSIYLASNTAVTITGTPTNARLSATSISRTLTAGGTNSGINFKTNAASGYACTTLCDLPFKTSLILTSTGTVFPCNAMPSDTLTYTNPVPANIFAQTGIHQSWLGTVTWNHPTSGQTNYIYCLSDGGGGLFILQGVKTGHIDDVARFSPANCPPTMPIRTFICTGPTIIAGNLSE